MTFGEKLKQARQNKELTQKQLAKKIGITDGMVTMYEKNQNVPKIETLKKICTELEVSADWLLGLADNKEA